MSRLGHWIQAARLRTLPLALSAICAGAALAMMEGHFVLSIFAWTCLTTILLQILSNFANDLGDHIKGTDDSSRVGPTRATQSGAISASQMRRGVIVMAIASLVSGLYLLYLSGLKMDLKGMTWLLLGLSAIGAAIWYTMGKKAYGYMGLGDISVLIFFGLIGVLGSYYLHGLQSPNGTFILPALSIGLLSTAVLNLNNMRDAIPDKAAGKMTLAVRLGQQTSRRYHHALILVGISAMIVFIALRFEDLLDLSPLLVAPLFVAHLLRVRRCEANKDLDPELKKVALSTFLMALLFLLSQTIAL